MFIKCFTVETWCVFLGKGCGLEERGCSFQKGASCKMSHCVNILAPNLIYSMSHYDIGDFGASTLVLSCLNLRQY